MRTYLSIILCGLDTAAKGNKANLVLEPAAYSTICVMSVINYRIRKAPRSIWNEGRFAVIYFLYCAYPTFGFATLTLSVLPARE